MKKVMYTFALLFAGVTMLMAQADYKMWATILVEPKIDKVAEFEKALAEHNKKYHIEGVKKISVWYIRSGSNGGKYMLAMGPLTFTDFDSFKHDKAHDADWNENVLPHVKCVSDYEYWKFHEELSHTPEGSSTGKEIFRVYDIKPWEGYRFKEVLKKVAAVHEEVPQDEYFHVYTSEFNSNSGRDVALSFGQKNWASLDDDAKFYNDYEKVHGDGSWGLLLEELQDIVVSYEDELSMRRDDLGGGN